MSKSTIVRGKLFIKEGSFTENLANRILSIDATTGEITDRPALAVGGFVSSTLPSAQIFVGNGSAVATAVAMTGDVTISNAGVTAIGTGVIVDSDVNASAAIAYSKLALTGSIVNADVSGSAAIAYSKLNLATSIVNADIATAAAIARTKIASGASYRILANNASGVMSENAALTANRVATVDSNGQLTTAIATTTATQLNYLNTATSNIQTQLNTKIASQNVDALVTTPTVAEDGYAITWDNTSNTYILADPVAQGLPTGGSARQYLIKTSGTNYDAAFGDPVLSDITDVTALADDLNLLTGADAAGLTSTELLYLNGVTSNIQSQLSSKQDRSLAYNAIWVGNISSEPAQLAAGTNGYVLTSVSGVPQWQPSVSGFANPMTTEGDFIIGDTGGAAIRIGIGTVGQILTSDGTTASWEDPIVGSGTVTSAAMSVPSFLSVAGSPITTSGTFAVTLATQTANTIFSGPTTGAAAAPTFRAMVTADLPNQVVSYAKIQNVAANSFLANVTGSSASVTAVATDRIPLFGSAITGTPSSSTYLRGDGSWVSAVPALTNGNGTTANGTAVDLGGDILSPSTISIPYAEEVTDGLKIEVDGFMSSPFLQFYREDDGLGGYLAQIDLVAPSATAGKYSMVRVNEGQLLIRAVNSSQSTFLDVNPRAVNPTITLFDNKTVKTGLDYGGDYSTDIIANDRSVPDMGAIKTGAFTLTNKTLTSPIINVGSDATGDLYQRSGTTFSRLASVSAGSFLRSGGVGTVSTWSTVKLPNTISAGSIWAANAANTMVEVTPSAGQSIRWNAGGTAWEAYTPGGGGGGSSWNLTGNTVGSIQKLGTIDNYDLRLVRNDVEVGRFGTSTLLLGLNAGDLNTGINNTFVGNYAGQTNSTGTNNTFIGSGAGNTSTGSGNVAIGRIAGFVSGTASNQLSIQNIIYGTGNNAGGAAISTGNIGIAVQAPTARFHLPAGTASANTAPLKFTTGTALTTPSDGAMEYHGSHLYFTIGSTRYQLDQQGGGGSVATDTIWDAAGDLAVGTGSNTAARLAIGAANTTLTSNGTTAAWSYNAPQTVTTATTYAVSDADFGSVIILNSPTGCDVTIPNTLTIPNFWCSFIKGTGMSGGDVTFIASSTTLNSIGGLVITETKGGATWTREGSGSTWYGVGAFGAGGATSPLTTKGDIYTYSTVDARLPVGTNGYILSADSAETTGLKWIAAPSGGGGGITNTAAANELAKSDGTNIVPSGIFSTTDGNILLGASAGSGTERTITAQGSGSDIGLSFITKGTGSVILDANNPVQLTRTGVGTVSSLVAEGGTNRSLALYSKGTGDAVLSGQQTLIYYGNISSGYARLNRTKFAVSGSDVVMSQETDLNLLIRGYNNASGDGSDIILQGGTGTTNAGGVYAKHSTSELIPLDKNGHETENADFTLDESHRGKIVYCTKAGTQTVTMPTGFIEGWNTVLVAWGATTVIATSGTVVGKTATTAQYETLALDHSITSGTYLGI